jgi:hypothetical protein
LAEKNTEPTTRILYGTENEQELEKFGIPFDEPIGIETLESRLRKAVVAARSQIVGRGQICAWARIRSKNTGKFKK